MKQLCQSNRATLRVEMETEEGRRPRAESSAAAAEQAISAPVSVP